MVLFCAKPLEESITINSISVLLSSSCTGFWWGNLRERLQGRPRRRWEDNIKMDLQEVGYGGMDWIELVQDSFRWRALVNAVMNLQVP